jgi:hypothetical protein
MRRLLAWGRVARRDLPADVLRRHERGAGGAAAPEDSWTNASAPAAAKIWSGASQAMQWICVLCGGMFLLSLIAPYQACTVSRKAGLYIYKGTGADWQKAGAFSQPLTASVRLQQSRAAVALHRCRLARFHENQGGSSE